MKNIYNKVKHIAVCAFLVASVSSCDNDIEDIGGAQQNYNTVYGLLQANSNLTTFATAIKLAGLEATLDTSENFTYFVGIFDTDEIFLLFSVLELLENSLNSTRRFFSLEPLIIGCELP